MWIDLALRQQGMIGCMTKVRAKTVLGLKEALAMTCLAVAATGHAIRAHGKVRCPATYREVIMASLAYNSCVEATVDSLFPFRVWEDANQFPEAVGHQDKVITEDVRTPERDQPYGAPCCDVDDALCTGSVMPYSLWYSLT